VAAAAGGGFGEAADVPGRLDLQNGVV